MSTAFVPRGVALTDKDGRATEAWYRFFQEMYQHSGLAGHQFPLWISIVVPAMQMTADDAAPPGLAVLAGGIKARAFDAAAVERMHFGIILPSTYGNRTAIRPVVVCGRSTADAGNVAWVLEYSWANSDGAFPGAATVSVTDDEEGTAGANARILGAAISASEQGPGSVLACSIYRNATDSADTYAADALLFGAGFVVENTGIGSIDP